jgi:hypothetical protein
VVIDVSAKALQDPDYEMTVADLGLGKSRTNPAQSIVLFHTGFRALLAAGDKVPWHR